MQAAYIQMALKLPFMRSRESLVIHDDSLKIRDCFLERPCVVGS